MKTLKYGFAAVLMGSASHAFAQYQTDALRMSQSQPVGTARTLGLAGATAAVGGDYGSVLVNPAGLGMFQRSEFSISPGFGFLNSDSRAFGTTSTDSRSNLNVASMGIVFANRRTDDDPSAWRASSFSLGLTRTADYNQSFRYSGRPRLNEDIFQRISENQGAGLDDLAFNTYLTDEDENGTFIPIDFDGTGQLNQGETVRRTGATTQFDFAYGASYQDKFYVGGGVGIVSSRYTAENVLTASDPQPLTPVSEDDGTSFASLTQRDMLQTSGTGINARIGVIYRPVQAVRIGASLQTPTYIRLSETYESSLQAQFDKPVPVEGQVYTSASSTLDPNLFDYAVTTPFRATGGVAVVLGKYGFVSGDVEYMDYAQARLSGYNNSADFGADNDAINRLYGSAVNVRLGAEARLDVFRLRVGYANYGSPYQNKDVNRSRSYFTGGVGVRQNNFFVDAAGVYGKSTQLYSPYVINSPGGVTPVVTVDDTRMNVTVTAGFLF